ncbi:MAG: helix-turn-helix transcriptional regulator [Oligoflexales bacterium]|nr:helix-turn-helix transcriptional regulator [Oligoflexales bacterium]
MANARKFLKDLVGDLTFGELLRSERKCEELTQEQLAKKIGVTKQAISNFESSKDFPKKEILKKIARFFKMDEETYVRYIVQDMLNKKGITGYTVVKKRA